LLPPSFQQKIDSEHSPSSLPFYFPFYPSSSLPICLPTIANVVPHIMTSSINPTAVPSITALRQHLNYGDAKVSQCQAFYDDLRAYRKKFVSSHGLEGSGLHDWKSRDHQLALGEMTRAFLERDGNGRRYWPDDEGSPHYNGLRYSSDHAKIKRIMKQLFFRLNLQQHRNTKYKKNKPDEASLHKRSGMTPGDAIDLDLIIEGPSNMPVSEPADSPRSSTIPTAAIRPNPTNANVIDPSLLDPQQQPSFTQELRKDPYHVPESPKSGFQIPRDRPIFGTMRAATSGQPRRSASCSEDEPLAKRAKTKSSSYTKAASASVEHDENHAEIFGHRISPRRRKPRLIPGMATPDKLAAAFESPERFSSPAIAEDVEVAGIDAEPLTNGPTTAFQPPPRPPQPSVEDTLDEESMDTYISHMTKELNSELGLHATEAVSQSAGTNTAPLAQMVPDRMALAPTSRASTSSLEPSSSLPLSTLATPTAPQGREEKENESKEEKTTTRSPPAKKSRVEFVYRVITRQPAYRGDPWVPTGNFRDKTISELEAELPIRVDAADLIGLRFVLLHLGSETRAEQIIPRGHDQKFAAAKRYFDGVIRSCIARTVGANQALIEFEIEALTDEKPVVDETFEEAFDW
ncbi:hypothetical protein CI238_00722, partial [Colletotrichum incanum]